jgi:hypothetical protein
VPLANHFVDRFRAKAFGERRCRILGAEKIGHEYLRQFTKMGTLRLFFPVIHFAVE